MAYPSEPPAAADEPAGPSDARGRQPRPSRHRRRRGRSRIVVLLTILGLLVAAGVGLAGPWSPLRSPQDDDGPTTAAPADSQPACSGDVLLTVVAAPAAASVVERAAAALPADEPLQEGQCLRIEVRAEDPGTTADALARDLADVPDVAKPQVWVPDSPIWAAEVARRGGIPQRLPADPPAIAESPIVVAMPRDRAQALGWPERQVGIVETLGLIANPAGWAVAGHPEWGRVTLGATDPATSSVAMHTLAARIGGLLARAGLPLEPASLARPEVSGGLLTIDRATVAQAATVPALLEPLVADTAAVAAPSSPSIFSAYEQQVWAHNAAGPAVPLAAFYPEGLGAIPTPYYVLDGAWVSDQHRQGAQRLLDRLLSPDAAATLPEAGFRPPGSVAVEAFGSEQGLRPDPVPLAQPLTPEQVALVASVTTTLGRHGNNIAVIDVSGSMWGIVPGLGRSKLDVVKEVATAGLSLFDDQDNLGLWVFSVGLDDDNDYRQLIPIGPMAGEVNGVPRRQALAVALDGMTPQAGTGLYDTAWAAYQAVAATYQEGRTNNVILLTDGINDDPNSITLDELLNRLREAYDPERPVHIIAIGYGADVNGQVLQAMTDAVEGATYLAPTAEELATAFYRALSFESG